MRYDTEFNGPGAIVYKLGHSEGHHLTPTVSYHILSYRTQSYPITFHCIVHHTISHYLDPTLLIYLPCSYRISSTIAPYYDTRSGTLASEER